MFQHGKKFFVLTVISMSSCTPVTTSTYADWSANRSHNEQENAILRCSRFAQVLSFDGDKNKSMIPDAGLMGPYTCTILIAPGQHKLVARYQNEFLLGQRRVGVSTQGIEVTFAVEAGKEYLLRVIGSDKVKNQAEFVVLPIERAIE